MLIFDVFSEHFLEGFWIGFGVVLGDFVVPKRCSKGKRTICGNRCFMYVILLLSGVVGSICGAKKREKQSANPIRIPTRFRDDFGSILRVILGAKIIQKSILILSVFLEGPRGGGWTSLLSPFGFHVAPQCPPGRF